MAVVDEELCSRDPFLGLLKEHLHKAKNNMKKYADLERTKREIKWVTLFTSDYNLISRARLGTAI